MYCILKRKCMHITTCLMVIALLHILTKLKIDQIKCCQALNWIILFVDTNIQLLIF